MREGIYSMIELTEKEHALLLDYISSHLVIVDDIIQSTDEDKDEVALNDERDTASSIYLKLS